MPQAEGAQPAPTPNAPPVSSDAGGEIRSLVAALRELGGEHLRAVIFFGSRLVNTSPDAHSAADLVLVVDRYRPFYRRVAERGITRRPVFLLSTLNRMLPPNIFHFTPEGSGSAGGKCFVVSERDLAHALSPRARDHFFRGRLAQRVGIVHAASMECEETLKGWLLASRRHALEWVPLFLGEPFTVSDLCLRMLELSYRAEIRPEKSDRAREVFEAQREQLLPLYEPLLADACAAGALTGGPAGYRRAGGRSWWLRQRWKWFFRQSRLRATLRWFKYMLTFDDWLEYIVHKVERRTGQHLELTAAERRWPLILLWPKAIRVLRTLGQQRAAAENGGAGKGTGDGS